MADLTQVASSVETCGCLEMSSTCSHIVGFGDFESGADREKFSNHDEGQKQQNLSDYGDGFVIDAVSAKIEKVFSRKEEHRKQHLPGDGYGKLSSQKSCYPICTEGEGNQVESKEECVKEMKQDGNGEDKHGEACEISCKEHCDDDGDRVLDVPIDVDACRSEMSTVSVNAEGQTYEVELCQTNEGMQSIAARPLTAMNGQNDSIPSLSSARRDEQSMTTPRSRKLASWHNPEPKARVFPEPGFIMEATAWPTLAEARHTKPSETRSLASNKEVVSVPSPAQKVPSSQEHSMEALKHWNANPSQSGSKYKLSYKKSSMPGYGKPSFPAAENIPAPPMGVHVPSVNVFIPDQSMKGSGIAGINNFSPGPHQAPGQGSSYYRRAEGLAPFPHNSAVMPAYGRWHPDWQHHRSRGYGDAHSGFVPQYDQHIGPRHVRSPITPFMNMNAAYYNYPNFQANMSYMPAAPSPGYNYATPYFGPSGPLVGMTQAPDFPAIQEKVQRQIEYYFSTENLCHDTFLTSKMDDEGFVPLSLIASFPRVRSITLNSFLILEAMKKSLLVEVKNGKLRSHDWRRWKPSLSGTSQTHGIESINLFVPLRHTGPDNAKEQEYGKSEESEEHGIDKLSALPESRLVAGSCAAPWTGISANLGAGSVPAVTSIDSR